MLQRILLFVLLLVGCSSPENVMEDYIEAKTWQDRLATVLHREKTKTRMEKYYSDTRLGGSEVEEIVRIDGEKEIDVGEYIKLKVSYTTSRDRRNTHLYYVKRTSDGYKIDWEASLGINEMSLKAYQVQRLINSMIFRVTAKLDDYYNYEFRNAYSGYLSVSLSDDGPGFPLYGYAKRDSKHGKRIYEILKDGEEHNLIVQVRFLRGGDYDSNTVLLEDLISEDWLLN